MFTTNSTVFNAPIYLYKNRSSQSSLFRNSSIILWKCSTTLAFLFRNNTKVMLNVSSRNQHRTYGICLISFAMFILLDIGDETHLSRCNSKQKTRTIWLLSMILLHSLLLLSYVVYTIFGVIYFALRCLRTDVLFT